MDDDKKQTNKQTDKQTKAIFNDKKDGNYFEFLSVEPEDGE